MSTEKELVREHYNTFIQVHRSTIMKFFNFILDRKLHLESESSKDMFRMPREYMRVIIGHMDIEDYINYLSKKLEDFLDHIDSYRDGDKVKIYQDFLRSITLF